jgi:hypothetical protein
VGIAHAGKRRGRFRWNRRQLLRIVTEHAASILRSSMKMKVPVGFSRYPIIGFAYLFA